MTNSLTSSRSGSSNGKLGSANNAMFVTVDGPRVEIPCHFNPEQFSISKTNDWAEPKTSGDQQSQFQFNQEGLRTISGLSLWFDTYEEDKDVRTVTDKLRDLMKASVQESGGTKTRPPHVVFIWGQYRSFTAVVTSITEEFRLFFADGRPARAKVTLSLKEVPQPQTGQNPTSRAAGARRMRMVQLGDTLDWIAYTELGTPAAWRILADANGLDDPRRLRPGQMLLIPAQN
jgi:hypothetical protein